MNWEREVARIQAKHGHLKCPVSMACDTSLCDCLGSDCAHFLPDENECAHVLAAQAQARIADALETIVHSDYAGRKYLRIKGSVCTGNE